MMKENRAVSQVSVSGKLYKVVFKLYMKVYLCFQGFETFKIVSIVALFALLSNLEICAFCTPISRPSSSWVKVASLRPTQRNALI